MCGIAGILNLSGQMEKTTTEVVVRKMLQAIERRGPDGQGFYFDSKIGLGFCRLAINDLSEKANQPITNEDGSIVSCCNGEIYNFRELREILEKKGHIFKSHSDSEVIVHLYEEFGPDFVQKLNGMFAIVLWDSGKKRLLLIRDRLGIKPLYYSIVSKKIIFGSEIKALLTYPVFHKEIDFEAMDFYFSYLSAPPSKTMFKNLKPVLAGNLLIVENGIIKEKKYWQIFTGKSSRYSFEGAKTKLFDLLYQSVEKHLVADVPIGFFLSGGNDSSSLLALAKLISPGKKFPTFTLGMKLNNGSLANRADFETARRLSKIFKTEHYELIISCRDFMERFEEISDIADEPFPLSPPSFFIAEKASQYVKVIISGDGGDELFGGYNYHQASFIRMPIFAHDKPLRLFSTFSHEEKKQLYNISSLRKESGAFYRFWLDFFRTFRFKDELNGILSFDLSLRLPRYSLMPLDFLSMHHSLEVRVPFLDDKVVDFSIKLPGRMKVNKEERKLVLKEAMKGLLPDEILTMKKSPFRIPKENWLFYSINNYIRPVLAPRRLKKHEFFNTAYIYRLIDLFQEISFRKVLHNDYLLNQLWALFCFQLWWEKHFG